MTSRLFAPLLLCALAILLAHPAAAQSDLIPYTVSTNTTDTNGDGIPDPSAGISGGYTCGCYCSVYTTTVLVAAAGQTVNGQTVSGGCTMDDSASVTSGSVDPTAKPTVYTETTCWGPCLQ